VKYRNVIQPGDFSDVMSVSMIDVQREFLRPPDESGGRKQPPNTSGMLTNITSRGTNPEPDGVKGLLGNPGILLLQKASFSKY
jgi:hypothetical protein